MHNISISLACGRSLNVFFSKLGAERSKIYSGNVNQLYGMQKQINWERKRPNEFDIHSNFERSIQKRTRYDTHTDNNYTGTSTSIQQICAFHLVTIMYTMKTFLVALNLWTVVYEWLQMKIGLEFCANKSVTQKEIT